MSAAFSYRWQHIHQKTLPDVIPPKEQDYAATPSGLLINELTYEAEGVLGPIERMMDLALALNTGRFAQPQGHVILFVVRLSVRVLSIAREDNKPSYRSCNLDFCA